MVKDAGEFLRMTPSADTALATLSEPVRRWFAGKFGEPTPIQRLAWPALATAQNLLLCAPTGTGKTLAAFLPIVDQLRASPGAGVRCRYLTPRKALDSDVRKNLRRALRDLAGGAVRVGLRTGDTGWKARQRLLRTPPDILLTTPESLAVMLVAAPVYGCGYFRELRWVVVDEI